jgi:2-amino-4-hydroxy-6-hydroxymethyldihydropteridine diphosphokinase
MVEALIGMGGNVDNVRTTLARAVELLCDGTTVRLIKRSSDYRTPPWGITAQAPFINLCLLVETELAPSALLDRALTVERQLGRNRAKEQRWGPRRLDIDLLAYDDMALDEPGLSLPHPRLFERAFVLVPLAEIVPERRIAGIRIKDALARVDQSGIEKLSSG